MIFQILLVFIFPILLSIGVNGQVPLKNPHEARGVLLLDSFTFPKLVPSEKHTFVVLVTNKQSIGDYGTDSIRADFFALGNFVQTREDETGKDMIFAQVLVNGADNARLAERIGMKRDFKHPRMFIYPANATKPIPYPETAPFHLQSLLRFIVQNSHYNYRMPGTLAKYDELVKEVAKHLYPETPSDQKNEDGSLESDTVLQDLFFKAKEIHSHYEKDFKDLSTPESKKGEQLTELDMSNVYINSLEKLLKQGKGFLKKEIDRLSDVLDEKKISKFTRTKLTYQLNVLKSFLNSKAEFTPEEIKKKQDSTRNGEF
jgi:hypothetical protein